MSITLPPKALGCTYEWALTVKKNGAAWDLTAGAVELRFQGPSGPVVTASATSVNPAGGVFSYTNAAGLLNAVGNWQLNIKTTLGSVVQELPRPFTFYVTDPP